MYSRDYRDVVGGGILAAIGLFWAYYAQDNYRLGTLRAMDSGMFPMWLGIILFCFGVLIVATAMVKKGAFEFPTIDWWTLAIVLVSVAVFAFGVRRIGIIPSIILQVVIVSFADNKLSHLNKAILSAILAFSAYLIFYVGLSLPLVLFAWRF